ncbi:hypothetical protein SO802_029469 [Lithocarpus litseifolius]|uniref:Uncharacterized protein n=1 Tax=Lithocarpus litseifolius TaxID=425828 RepID=A0AAW2BWH4_9ROSI
MSSPSDTQRQSTREAITKQPKRRKLQAMAAMAAPMEEKNTLESREDLARGEATQAVILTKPRRRRFDPIRSVATPDGEGGETRNRRLQVFFSSLLSSFGGVFCYNNSQEQEQDMVSRALVPLQQQQLKGSYVLPPKPGVCVLAFSFEKPFDFEITEGLTRRVLQDIGNMVAERAVEVKLQAQPIARLLLGAVSMLVLLLKGTLLR